MHKPEPSPEQQALTLQEAIDVALQHHSSGDLPKAKEIYQQILQTEPYHPDALHLLGVISHQAGENDRAVDLITKALTVKPDFTEAHSNLGLALKELGQFKEAIASHHKAIEINPYYAEAHNNLGNVLRAIGRLDEAVSRYREAIKIKPEHAKAYNNLGNALHDLDQLDEAVVSYHKALDLKPNYAEGHNNLGVALQELAKLDEATTNYHKAIEIKPEFAEGHYNLHTLLLDLDNVTPSIGCMQTAVDIKPHRKDFRFILGMLLDYSGYPQEAKPHFDMVENGANADHAKLDAWRYIKSANKRMPPIIGSRVEALELGIDAAVNDGLVMEFGVMFGTSIRQIAALVEQEVHGFDSFEGLPEAWHHLPKGSYSTKGVIPTVQENVTLHKGWFEETLPGFIEKHQAPVRFMNIDCDIYSSTRTVLEHLAKQIIPGTVIVFDEYIGNASWREDEFKAFQEAVVKYGWNYEYLCFSFMTKQAVIRIN